MDFERLIKIRKTLVTIKIYVQRAVGWMNLITSTMIVFLFLAQLKEYGLEFELTKWFIPIIVSTFLLMILFGYFEVKLGGLSEEEREHTLKNPVFFDMVDRLERIERKIK